MLSASSIFRANDPYEQLISQIIRLESLPQEQLKLQRQAQSRTKDVLSEVDSNISALHTLLTDFTAQVSNPFAAKTVTGGDEGSFAVSAGAGAQTGTHTLRVERLARADTRVSLRHDAAGAELRSFFDGAGAQTFSIEVAHPTEADPDNRVAIDVTVDPTGTTNDAILGEIADAIDTAMTDAVAAGTITNAEKAGAELVRETSDTARLSIRSGRTGYANRLGFVDSAGGLLAALDVNSTAVVGEGGISSQPTPASVTGSALTAPITIDDITVPPTAASLTGNALSAPITIDNSNNRFKIDVDGTQHSFNLTKTTYNTLDDLAAELQGKIGNDVVVSVDNGALKFETAATGSASSLQVIDSEAVATLGLTAMASPVYGEDQQTLPPTIDLVTDGTTINATIPKGTYNTLDDLAAAIQGQVGANVTVSATNGALTFETVSTGAGADLQILGGDGLAQIGFSAMGSPTYGADAGTSTGSSAAGGMMTALGTGELDSELNAVFDLNGLTHYRATNAVTDALEGVTIDLTQPGEVASEFSIVANEESIQAQVEDFIGKYNDLMDRLHQDTHVDSEAETRGALAGEFLFNDLRFGLRSELSRAVAGQPADGPDFLQDLGITISRDGTLELTDADALLAAVETDAGAVQSLFAGPDGVATRMVARLDRFTGTDGIIENRQEVIDDRIARLDDRISAWDDRLERRTEILRDQYARLQEAVALFEGQQGVINSFFYSGF